MTRKESSWTLRAQAITWGPGEQARLRQRVRLRPKTLHFWQAPWCQPATLRAALHGSNISRMHIFPLQCTSFLRH